MARKIKKEELYNAVKNFLESNGGWVRTGKFKQFLARFGYSPSYINIYLMNELKIAGIIETFRSPSGIWIVRLPKKK